ncbi:hypothetical protein TIFTF001_025033 [Ficus carica]|uniref:Uncharacterized protein n=1 Tax=Ficus carica TaxID=3494 RepID=A0AA88DKH3_FICCA|nr:hypothetical protein TIFTF001_025033 [Ficus carica]
MASLPWEMTAAILKPIAGKGSAALQGAHYQYFSWVELNTLDRAVKLPDHPVNKNLIRFPLEGSGMLNSHCVKIPIHMMMSFTDLGMIMLTKTTKVGEDFSPILNQTLVLLLITLSPSSLHWLVSRNHSVSSLASNYLDLFIVSFDIVTEELRDMPLPYRANIDVLSKPIFEANFVFPIAYLKNNVILLDESYE